MRGIGLLLLGLLAAAALPGFLRSPKAGEALKSGVEKGRMLPAYNPQHVTGPDRGTATCPV